MTVEDFTFIGPSPIVALGENAFGIQRNQNPEQKIRKNIPTTIDQARFLSMMYGQNIIVAPQETQALAVEVFDQFPFLLEQMEWAEVEAQQIGTAGYQTESKSYVQVFLHSDSTKMDVTEYGSNGDPIQALVFDIYDLNKRIPQRKINGITLAVLDEKTEMSGDEISKYASGFLDKVFRLQKIYTKLGRNVELEKRERGLLNSLGFSRSAKSLSRELKEYLGPILDDEYRDDALAAKVVTDCLTSPSEIVFQLGENIEILTDSEGKAVRGIEFDELVRFANEKFSKDYGSNYEITPQKVAEILYHLNPDTNENDVKALCLISTKYKETGEREFLSFPPAFVEKDGNFFENVPCLQHGIECPLAGACNNLSSDRGRDIFPWEVDYVNRLMNIFPKSLKRVGFRDIEITEESIEDEDDETYGTYTYELDLNPVAAGELLPEDYNDQFGEEDENDEGEEKAEIDDVEYIPSFEIIYTPNTETIGDEVEDMENIIEGFDESELEFPPLHEGAALHPDSGNILHGITSKMMEDPRTPGDGHYRSLFDVEQLKFVIPYNKVVMVLIK